MIMTGQAYGRSEGRSTVNYKDLPDPINELLSQTNFRSNE